VPEGENQQAMNVLYFIPVFKSGSRHQVKFFVDPGHIAKGDRNFVLKDASIIYKTLQRLQQHDKAPYT